jgi:hypothetical protein
MKREVGILLLIFLSLSFVSAQHSASEVQISVSGNSMSLQSAINNGYFKTASYTYASPATTLGHSTTQIWISIKGVEKTLSSALSNAYGLCSSGSVTRYYSSAIPNPSHLGTDIILSSGKTLQKAIDDGDFCCIPRTCGDDKCGSYDNGCSGTINCGSCTAPYECKTSWWISGHICICSVTTTCGSQNCGSKVTNCGTTISCGSCSSGYECSSGYCTYVSSGGDSPSEANDDGGDTSHTNPFTGATGDYDGDGQTDGGSGGGGGGGKLICTELYRQGLMEKEIYLADQEFGLYMKETHPEIMEGYTNFAIPIVEKMKESESFTHAVNVVVKPWSEEMAHKAGVRKSGNFVGAIIMNVGMVIFWITGSLALGQISILFLAQMTMAIVLLVASMIYLNKKRR